MSKFNENAQCKTKKFGASFDEDSTKQCKKLNEIEINRDNFQEILTEQIIDPHKHFLIKQINQWEKESIKKIQQTANEYRYKLFEHIIRHINHIEINLNQLNDQIKENRQEKTFKEVSLQKLKQLSDELDKIPNVSIQQASESLINKNSILVPSQQLFSYLHINNNTKWIQNGFTIAGGNGYEDQLNQLYRPYGICIDDNDQSIYVADCYNHRIVKWKYGANKGEIVAGGNGKGNRTDQVSNPTDVIIDKKTDSIIICDQGNRRVMRWPRQNTTHGQIIISNISCSRLTIDHNGDLYISDYDMHEVRRWNIEKQNNQVIVIGENGLETNGILVAGGNGQGYEFNQFNGPNQIFIDKDFSVYVTDWDNHRVMKWMKGAKEGIVVAGGQGQGNDLSQLDRPAGVIGDHLGNIYIADSNNDRIVRWSPGSTQGSIVVGGNDCGIDPNQLDGPMNLSFDEQGNLYVVDCLNHRIQKFFVDLT